MLGMARPLRIQYEGAIYHLVSRGHRREEILRNDVDRKRFLQSSQRSGTTINLKWIGRRLETGTPTTSPTFFASRLISCVKSDD
jgi:hypothetical protein